MRFKFKHKVGFAFSMIRVQFPLKLCYAMTVNKSQSQSFLKALFDTTVETFSHGQAYVALSRIRFYNEIKLIISKENIIEYDGRQIATLLNCVYPSVILKNEDSSSDDSNVFIDETLNNLYFNYESDSDNISYFGNLDNYMFDNDDEIEFDTDLDTDYDVDSIDDN